MEAGFAQLQINRVLAHWSYVQSYGRMDAQRPQALTNFD